MNIRLLDELSAAELVSSEALMQVAGLTLPVCEAFHAAFVDLIEDVGDFDGLIVTPHLLIVGGDHRVEGAVGWLRRRRRWRGATDPVTGSQRFAAEESFHLVWAAETNPSLTFASTTAVAAYLVDDTLDTAIHCGLADADRLTVVAIELLRQGLPDRAGSDATGLHRIRDRPDGTACVGMMEV